ncbi:hypothetical protein CVT24_000172 [Panaeolus cyanescens]|uniref:Lysophospholipase n=1 Tax=Panaeolus cyanescens TaxID=181874 RepID=A0A409VWU1_9AGAR|nr:hypothetical protein CVT24_000172 [Panaeolus cyanescens]
MSFTPQGFIWPRDSIDDYAPSTNVACPDLSTSPLIRTFSPQNQSIHPLESQYIQSRINDVLPDAWKDWLGDGSAIEYNLDNITTPFPKVGIALPGGGLRAAQFAAAALAALDGRNATAKNAGTGGLLQVASYISGLSGGSWTIGSLVFNDFPLIHDLVFGTENESDGWLLDIPLVTPDGDDVLSSSNQAFYGSILQSVISKAKAGIDTSMTDPWSRMISYHFLNQTSRQNFFTNNTAHGAGQLWSRILTLPAYQKQQLPFPIVVANSRPSGSKLTTILPLNSTVYEITPLELASFDPSLSAAMNISYAGTHLTDGRSDNGSSCVQGFDQAGFVMGTSASLFNQLFDFARNTLSQFSQSDSSGLTYVLSRQLSQVRTRADDVANWPNPFNGLQSQTFQDSGASWLELIDGSSNQENIPYNPLFVRSRDVDVVITLEGSADTSFNWPNGTGLVFSALRQTTFLQSSHKPFPPFPATPDDFISTGVNARPTFFGCDPPPAADYPLIVYLPNAPPIDGGNPVTK